MKVSIITKPLATETVCGDQGRCWRDGERSIICLADGLGHGCAAADAATAALDHVQALTGASMERMFEDCNRAIRSTRGVAMAMAIIEDHSDVLTFAAIGNIRAVLIHDVSLSLPGDYGIVGAGYQRLIPFKSRWRHGDILAMWSDGLPSAIPFSAMPPALLSKPDALAEWMMETHATHTDDAGVICALLEAAP